MKKFVSLLICFVMVSVLFVSAVALTGENYAMFSSSSNVDVPVNEHIGGDANGDGKVTLIDVVALLRVCAGDMSNTSYHGLDANEDGVRNIADVLMTLSYILGNDVPLGELVEAK